METPRLRTKHRLRLSDAYSDLFILTTQLKSLRDYGDPEALRQRIKGIFEASINKGQQAGIPEKSLEGAKYALAAFLDEIILTSPWPQKEQWLARPLQYEYFGEHIAGVEFFSRLETLRRASNTQQDLLEVYYLCLILGFEGQYKLHGQDKLTSVISELSREIKASGASHNVLSPQGKRPDEFMALMKQGLPAWVMVVSCLTLVSIFFLTLSFLTKNDANEVTLYLTQLLELRQ